MQKQASLFSAVSTHLIAAGIMFGCVLQHLTCQAAPITADVQTPSIQAAQNFRSVSQPVKPMNDTTIIAEAEEFRASQSTQGWHALPWGANYYAATLANSFLSRKGFLGAPEQAEASATITVEVPKAGKYLTLTRYEAAPGFETQYRLRIEQNGQSKLDRLYGARDSLKIWAFGQKLQKEVTWSWGAVENMVWEGHDATVDLEAGTARLTLIADKQPTPAARRNIDLVMLTSDEEQVQQRIEKEGFLPLDGMLTQSGDVYLKLHNAAKAAVTLNIPNGVEHSPYWVHLRDWKSKTVTAAPGETTDWVEVGSLLDTLNDGQWKLAAQGDSSRYTLEFGVRDAGGNITTIRRLENLNGDIELAYDANTRYTRRIGTSDEVLYNLVDYLRKQPIRGRAPQLTSIYGYTFDPRPNDPKYTAAREKFMRLTGVNAMNVAEPNLDALPRTGPARGYIDVRSLVGDLTKLEEYLQTLKSAGHAERIGVVSLGDEIGLPNPTQEDQTRFQQWLQKQRVPLSQVGSAAGGDWNQVHINTSEEAKQQSPELYYYSKRYVNEYGIEKLQAVTQLVQKYVPNAGIGANFSPHHGVHYLGETHQWVTLFRKGGMTMPWSEDYIWQVPVGSQQMNFLNVDLFRAGIKGKPDAKIHYYVMPHWPGNTPDSWRRQFYGDIGHGVRIFNLFEFRPVQAAYTENHVSLPAMFQEVRRSLYELGTFEEIVQSGRVRPAQAALWFSEAGDIWDNSRAPYGAGKRTLYVAIRHQQLPLDVLVEADALAGDLKNYQVLYLTDRNVSRAASRAIAQWVERGGQLFATAGAGMLDEFNRPNDVLRGVLGVEENELIESEDPIRWAKQDLPFAKPLQTVKWKEATIPVFGARSRFTSRNAGVLASFADGAPAITSRKVGRGTAMYVGFLPGLSYFHPAIPQRPVDRGSTDDSMAHFIPTNFHRSAGELMSVPAAEIKRPVIASEPLVESSIIESREGVLIPLVNWSEGPIENLKVDLDLPTHGTNVTLASGKPVEVTLNGLKTTLTLDLNVADAVILR